MSGLDLAHNLIESHSRDDALTYLATLSFDQLYAKGYAEPEFVRLVFGDMNVAKELDGITQRLDAMLATNRVTSSGETRVIISMALGIADEAYVGDVFWLEKLADDFELSDETGDHPCAAVRKMFGKTIEALFEAHRDGVFKDAVDNWFAERDFGATDAHSAMAVYDAFVENNYIYFENQRYTFILSTIYSGLTCQALKGRQRVDFGYDGWQVVHTDKDLSFVLLSLPEQTEGIISSFLMAMSTAAVVFAAATNRGSEFLCSAVASKCSVYLWKGDARTSVDGGKSFFTIADSTDCCKSCETMGMSLKKLSRRFVILPSQASVAPSWLIGRRSMGVNRRIDFETLFCCTNDNMHVYPIDDNLSTQLRYTSDKRLCQLPFVSQLASDGSAIRLLLFEPLCADDAPTESPASICLPKKVVLTHFYANASKSALLKDHNLGGSGLFSDDSLFVQQFEVKNKVAEHIFAASGDTLLVREPSEKRISKWHIGDVPSMRFKLRLGQRGARELAADAINTEKECINRAFNTKNLNKTANTLHSTLLYVDGNSRWRVETSDYLVSCIFVDVKQQHTLLFTLRVDSKKSKFLVRTLPFGVLFDKHVLVSHMIIGPNEEKGVQRINFDTLDCLQPSAPDPHFDFSLLHLVPPSQVSSVVCDKIATRYRFIL